MGEKVEEEAKVKPQHPELSQDLLELDFNSQLEELPDISETEDMPKEPELVLQSISPLFLNTSPLRFSNLQATLPRTTREAELSKTHPTCCQKRRRTRQTSRIHHHRFRRCSSKHPRLSPPIKGEVMNVIYFSVLVK